MWTSVSMQLASSKWTRTIVLSAIRVRKYIFASFPLLFRRVFRLTSRQLTPLTRRAPRPRRTVPSPSIPTTPPSCTSWPLGFISWYYNLWYRCHQQWDCLILHSLIIIPYIDLDLFISVVVKNPNMKDVLRVKPQICGNYNKKKLTFC